MKVPITRIVSLNGDVFGHFLLSAITVAADKNMELPNPDEYNVTLTINGIEMPVEEVFIHWHNKLDRSVELRAEQLFAEKFRDVRDIFWDLTQTISAEMGDAKVKICNKLNLEYFPNEDTL
jgi:hypothetical protein